MARPFWQRFMEWDRHPWNQKTFDPRMSVIRDGVDVTVGGQVPLDLRNPYQMATDPRFQAGTGPGLGQIENPTFSASRQKGNIGKDMVGATPRPEDWESPFGDGRRDDEESLFSQWAKYAWLKHMINQGKYSGTSTVEVGPAQRDFFNIPYYGSPFPGGTNV